MGALGLVPVRDHKRRFIHVEGSGTARARSATGRLCDRSEYFGLFTEQCKHLYAAWWLLASIVLIFIQSSVAYAATGAMSYDDMCVYWGPNPVGTGYGNGAVENGVIITANSKANAALLACGVSVTDNRLTHDVKQALGSSSSGGAFYRLAQMMHSMSDSGGYSYPGWNGNAPTGIMDTLATTLGPENVWYCDYTDDELASAIEDLTVILNGGNIGGGSGGGDSGGGGLSSEFNLYYTNGNNNGSVSRVVTISDEAKTSIYNALDNIFGDGADENIYFMTNPYWLWCIDTNDGELVFDDNGNLLGFKNTTDENTILKNISIFVTSNGDNIEITGSDGTWFGHYLGANQTYDLSNCTEVSTYGLGDGGGSGSSSGGGTSEPGIDPPDPGDDLEWPDPVNVNVDIDFDTSDIVYVLSQILADMRNLDRSTNDLVDLTPVITAINGLEFPETDLSNVEDYLERILTALGEVSGIDFNGINGMLSYIHNDLGDTNDALADIETAIDNISMPSPPDLSGIRSDLSDIETAIGNITIPAAPNLTDIQTTVEDILDMLEHADYGTDMTQVEDLLSTNNARLGSILTAINGLDMPETDLTETVSAIDDVADACTDIYTDIHAYFADMLGYWDGIDDNFVTFFTSWPDWVSDWSGKWSSLMTKLDQIYRRLGKKPWTGDVVGDPGIDLPDPGTDIVPIGDDDIGFPLPHFDWDELAPILHIPALRAAILELMSKFPFCMLNELVSIGTMIQRQPMAPVFEVPAPNPSDWSHPHMVRIDLSQFDVCAAVLRGMIMIWAAVRISNRTIKMWMGDKEVY